MFQRLYTVSSAYPILSVLPLSADQFSVLLPLDNQIQLYSTRSAFCKDSIQCPQSQYLDLVVNEGFLSRGRNSISHTNRNNKETIEIAEELVSPCIQLQNKVVTMDGNSAFRIFEVDHDIRQNSAPISTGLRGARQMCITKTHKDTFGFSPVNGDQLNVFNLDKQATETRTRIKDPIQSLIDYNSSTLICGSENLYFYDARIRKLANMVSLGHQCQCVKTLGESLFFSHQNKISELNLRRNSRVEFASLGDPDSTRIESFQLIGDSLVIQNQLSNNVEVYYFK